MRRRAPLGRDGQAKAGGNLPTVELGRRVPRTQVAAPQQSQEELGLCPRIAEGRMVIGKADAALGAAGVQTTGCKTGGPRKAHGAESRREVDLMPEPGVLGGQEAAVEPDVVGDEDGSLKACRHVASHLAECRSVADIPCGDAVDVRRPDVALGVHQRLVLVQALALRREAHDGDLDDPIVVPRREACRLHVHDGDVEVGGSNRVSTALPQRPLATQPHDVLPSSPQTA